MPWHAPDSGTGPRTRSLTHESGFSGAGRSPSQPRQIWRSPGSIPRRDLTSDRRSASCTSCFAEVISAARGESGYILESVGRTLWTPEAFLLRSEFCSRADYEAIVDIEARRAQVNELFVVPLSDFAFFRKLSFTVSKTSTRLLEGLGEQDFQFGHPLSAKQLRDSLAAMELVEDPKEEINELGCEFLSSARQLVSSGQASAMLVEPSTSEEALKLFVLFVGSHRPGVGSMERVLAAANGTSLAEVHFADRLATRNTQTFDSALKPGDDSASVERLLQIAVDRTPAVAAAAYTVDPATGQLGLAGTFVGEASTVEAKELVPNHSASSVAFRQRTHLQTFDATNEESSWRSATLVELLELAIPIVGLTTRPADSRLGALSLLYPTQVELRTNELELLRSIAVRIAVAVEYHQREDVLTYVSRTVESRHERRTSAPVAARPVASKRVPSPYRKAAPGVAEILARAAVALRTGHATARVITSGVNERHCLELNRIALWPGDAREDDTLSISLYHPSSLNAAAARTGKTQYRPHLVSGGAADQSALAHRPHTVSELVVPIRASGRTVGTLNFESVRPNAFDRAEGTARLFASLIGLELARAETAVAQRVVESAAHLKANLHLIDRSVSELADLADDLSGSVADDVRDIATDLAAVGYSTANGRATSSRCEERFLDLVLDAAEREGFDIGFAEGVYDTTILVGQDHVPAVRAALSDILGKVSELSPSKTPVLRRQNLDLGGVASAIYKIQYSVGALLDDGLPGVVYWEPVRPRARDGEDRTHLGSYLAAAALRAVGVDAYLSILGPTQASVLFRCAIEGG